MSDPNPQAAPDAPTRFTYDGVRRGFIAGQPLALGALVYGITFGILALGSGIGALEALFMSLAVYSSSAQTAAVGAIATGAGIYATVATVLLLNARYLLYGAALRPWMGDVPQWKAYSSLYVLGDGNWVLAMRARAEGEADAGFVMGSGLAMFFPWMTGTLLGAVTGGWIPNANALALDFFLAAFCAAMLVGMARSKPDYASAAAALVAALVTNRFLSGGWPIVAAGVAGIVVAYFRTPPAAEEAK